MMCFQIWLREMNELFLVFGKKRNSFFLNILRQVKSTISRKSSYSSTVASPMSAGTSLEILDQEEAQANFV